MHRSFKTSLAAALALVLSACGGGGGGGNVPVTPTATPPPPSVASAFTCPSSSTSFASAGGGASSAFDVVRRPVSTHRIAPTAPTMLAVRYAPSVQTESAIARRAREIGAQHVASLHFDGIGQHVRILHVDPARFDSVRSQLARTPGVIGVGIVHRVRTQGVSREYITSDPYFKGVTGSVAPLYQTAATPGQWDMHIMGLGYAFEYSQPSNGSGMTSAGALGSTGVRLAIIDTGEDITHPELAGAHVVRTQCFITNANGTAQSVGTYVTDPDGHGTDVTGIAAAASNNGFGFTGAAGTVSLMLYRVFPTPDDACSNPSTTDPQCSTSTLDVASAINDAVSNGANVISLSLGTDGTPCTNGVDPDQTEGAAIANAIAHNVVVVSASGNASASTVDPPGCDTGVIAVGASAYNDGAPNGSGYTGANREYVANYSNYGTGSWGLVAPGGDPTSNDADNLHWIENIWTSTPFDPSFAGACGTDSFGASKDCRILIAGTSMATPHVAGAAALVLSVNSAYQNPAAMKQLLCSTADNIGDPHQGCGRINVYRAVAKALNDPNLP